MKYTLIALAIAIATPAVAGQTCAVKTFAGETYLATLLNADGSTQMTRAEAEASADLLNIRHNTGENPVKARLFCD